MSVKQKPDFVDILAARILYQLERQGLIRVAGNTVDETLSSVKRAREIVKQMILNGDRQGQE